MKDKGVFSNIRWKTTTLQIIGASAKNNIRPRNPLFYPLGKALPRWQPQTRHSVTSKRSYRPQFISLGTRRVKINQLVPKLSISNCLLTNSCSGQRPCCTFDYMHTSVIQKTSLFPGSMKCRFESRMFWYTVIERTPPNWFLYIIS